MTELLLTLCFFCTPAPTANTNVETEYTKVPIVKGISDGYSIGIRNEDDGEFDGLEIKKVRKPNIAQAIGLNTGDVIVMINNHDIQIQTAGLELSQRNVTLTVRNPEGQLRDLHWPPAL